MIPYGTLANAGAIIVGGLAGVALRSRMGEGVQSIVFQGLGLCVVAIGIDMTIPLPPGELSLLVLFSVVIGGVIGRLLHLEDHMEGLGDRVKKWVGSEDGQFTEGLVTAFLVFCVGALTILGAFEEGLNNNHTLYYTKAMLDGFAALALAATYGIGVVFSFIPLLIYQLSLTYGAFLLTDLVDETMIQMVSNVGGILILGIGINLLGLKKIAVGDLLPSLPCIVLLVLLFT